MIDSVRLEKNDAKNYLGMLFIQGGIASFFSPQNDTPPPFSPKGVFEEPHTIHSLRS